MTKVALQFVGLVALGVFGTAFGALGGTTLLEQPGRANDPFFFEYGALVTVFVGLVLTTLAFYGTYRLGMARAQRK